MKNKNTKTAAKRSYRQLNKTAKQAFYIVRQRRGDVTRLSETTGLSVGQVSNVVAGRRSVSQELANEMYNISRRRVNA